MLGDAASGFLPSVRTSTSTGTAPSWVPSWSRPLPGIEADPGTGGAALVHVTVAETERVPGI
jgi:hypothetical protein